MQPPQPFHNYITSSPCAVVDSLLKPTILVDLLKKLSLKSEFYRDTFTHNISLLKNLPVVLSPWPAAQINNLASIPSQYQQKTQSVIKWAEKYELFYSLGYNMQFEVYFIPLLATTEVMSEEASYDWPEEDEDGEHWFDREDVTILYAQLNFPAVSHFFYSVLAEILKDVVNNNLQDASHKLYINFGCTEAIMPIHVPEISSSIVVYLKYNILQNVIEFRTE